MAGVNNQEQLASGRDGWDLGQSWKGYSAVASDKANGSAFRRLAAATWYSEPLARRYTEFKPLRGAIQNLSKNESAFWHRDALWWSLSSVFLRRDSSPDDATAILRNSRQYHTQFLTDMGENYAGGYASYIDHGKWPAIDRSTYYGTQTEWPRSS
jgi:hypothetical protein